MTTHVRRHLWLADASRCIGCFGCEAACKMEHGLPGGPRTVRVIQIGPRGEGDDLAMSFQPTSCCHCDRPACVLACPTGAMQKRADGIVFSDLSLCIGCQTCAVACPFGVPQLNPAFREDCKVRRVQDARRPGPVAGLHAQVPLGSPDVRDPDAGGEPDQGARKP